MLSEVSGWCFYLQEGGKKTNVIKQRKKQSKGKPALKENFAENKRETGGSRTEPRKQK